MWTKLHFLNLGLLLLFLRSSFLLLGLKDEFAVVHDLTDGRLTLRGDLHKIESSGFSSLYSFFEADNSNLLSFCPN